MHPKNNPPVKLGDRQINVRLTDGKKRAFHRTCLDLGIAMQNFLEAAVDRLLVYHELPPKEAEQYRVVIDKAKALAERHLEG
jgi:hypothetical protein